MSLLPDKAIGNQSITRRLTASLIVTVLIVSIIAVTAMHRVVSQTAIQGLERKADETLAYLVGTLEMPLWAVDDEGVRTIGRAVSQDESIVRLIIRNDSGAIIFSMEKDQDSDLINRSGKIIHKQRNQEKLAGDVAVSMTTAIFKKGNRQALFFSILIIFLILISIVIVTVVSIRLFLSKPLKSINEIANRFASGSYDTSGHPLPYLEFQPFGRALARMAERIDQHIRMAREAEAKYRDIFENAIEGIFQSTIEGKFLNTNPALVGILGYDSVDEFLACHIPNALYTDPEERNRFLAQLQEQGAVTGYEVQLHRKDEQVIWASITARMVRDQAGNPLYIEGFLTDITERKRTEEEKQRLEERLHTLVNTIPDLIWLKDVDGVYLTCNRMFELFFGATEADIVGKTDYDFVSKELADFFREHDRRAMALGKSSSNEEWITFASDGHRALLDTIKTPMYDALGMLIGVLGIGRDITERKQAEEALRESQQQLADIINFLPDATLVIDKEGKVIAWNKAIEAMTGIPAEDMIGKGDREYALPFYGDRRPILIDLTLHPDPELEKKEYTAIQRTGDILFGEAYTPKLAPGNVHLSATASVLRDSKGEIIAAIECIRDNTERKRLESQLQQAQKMEAIGTLAGGIAHDFNNILAGIIGYTELYKEVVRDRPKVYQSMEQVLKAAERAKDLVRQILAFSRKVAQEKKPLMLTPIVKEVVKFMRASLPTTIEIIETIDVSSDAIMADPSQMHQVLMNLCTNAGHAMKKAGGILEIGLKRLLISAEDLLHHPSLRLGYYLELTVRDSGTGIPAEDLGRIFEPYFTTKDRSEGTGLGLAVVHGIVKDHGGEIMVYSELGKGSIFRVYLPLIEKQEEYRESEEETILPGKGETILFVDDEQMIVDANRQFLEELGYRVFTETDPLKAIETFNTDRDTFDLVITDKTMPHMTGFDVAREIRSIRMDIPIVLCSGFLEKEDQEKLTTLGISQFIAKPMRRSLLAKAIRDVLDKSKIEA